MIPDFQGPQNVLWIHSNIHWKCRGVDCLVSNCCKRNCSQVPILASPQLFVQIDQVCFFLVTGGHDCGHRWQPNLGFRWSRSTGYWDSYWQAWPLCCCSRHQSSACKKHIYPMYFWEHKPSVSNGTVPDSPIKWNEANCTIALCIVCLLFFAPSSQYYWLCLQTLLPTFLNSMLAFFVGCWFTSISINSSAHNAFSHVHLISFLILEHCSIADAGSTSSYWCWDEQPATSWQSSMWVAICTIGHWGQYSGSIFKSLWPIWLNAKA